MSVSSYGADTVEVFDAGALDVEFYLAGSGWGADADEQRYSASPVVGFGLINSLSLYTALTVETDRYLADTVNAGSFGLIGAPLDTDHFDIDLLLDITTAGSEPGDTALTGGIELNLDLRPDQALAGLYARVEPSLSSEEDSDQGEPDLQYATSVNHTFGAYWTVAEGHQILAEYYRARTRSFARGETSLETHTFALGYNVEAHPNLELATDFFTHLPHDGEDFYCGASFGIIGSPTVAAE